MASRTLGRLIPLLGALALALAPADTQAQERGSTGIGPVAPLSEAFVPGPVAQQAVDPFLVFAFGPTIARNFELSAFRFGVALEALMNPTSINQVLSFSANLGRLSNEFRNFWTASAMAGVVFGEGPVLNTILPRVRAGIVGDRSSFKMGSTDPRTEFGLSLSAGVFYGFTQALVGSGDISLERVAGLNTMVLSLTLLLGPLGSLSLGS